MSVELLHWIKRVAGKLPKTEFSSYDRPLDLLIAALASVATDKVRVSVVDAVPESAVNLTKVSGVALTARDWSVDFVKLQNLDVALSTRASEATLSNVYSRLAEQLERRVFGSDYAATPTYSVLKVTADGLAHVSADAVANPSNLDVALSTRASESTLSALKNALASVGTDKFRASIVDALPQSPVTIQTDNVGLAKDATLSSELTRFAKLRGYSSAAAAWQDIYTDGANRLKVQLDAIPNPSNLDVALSTRASESTLSAIKGALASVATDKFRASVVDALPAGTNVIGEVKTPDFRDAVTASGSVAAASNTAGLAVAINNDWRTLVQFRATLGGAGTVILEASPNGTDYYKLWSKDLTAAGSYCDWDLCAFPYFRVRVPTTGIDIAVDIRAVKV